MKGADIILCRAVSTALGAECRDSKALEVGEPALDSSILVGKRKRFGQEVEAKDPIMDDVTLHYFAQSNGFTYVIPNSNQRSCRLTCLFLVLLCFLV
jgi:hypothetical protein